MGKRQIATLIVLCHAWCSGFEVRAGEPFVPGQVIDHVLCKSDPTQSYALYIPARGNRVPLPVIYFFDSHGAGAFPLNKYKALADSYGYILIGSNNSKNGNDFATAETIWSRLFDDTRKRLAIDEHRIYACGFSGGAKVAGYLAIEHDLIKGVIINGAGLPDEVSAGNFPFSITAITGEGDMNMTGLVAFNDDLDKTKTRHRLLFFAGKHEWAPVATMGIAVEGLTLDAMQAGAVPKDVAAIHRYTTRSRQRLDADVRAGELVKAVRECTVSVSYLNGLSQEVDWFRHQIAGLDQVPNYQKEMASEQHLLDVEQHTKDVYMQQFEQGDVRYWTNTINDLRTRSGEKTATGGMSQRLLAFLSLEFYSISTRFINSNSNSEARHFVQLYQLADPGNSEAWYYSAILDARGGDRRGATNDLMKAVDKGFNDKGRLSGQAEFRGMNLAIVEAGMH